MSPLYSHLNKQIETLIEEVETERSVWFLEALRSNLVQACDPLDVKDGGDEFRRVVLVLSCSSRFLDSGLVDASSTDVEKLQALLSVQNLPTNL